MSTLNKKKLEEIRKRVSKHNSNSSDRVYKEHQETQKRLRSLVDEHGVDGVSVATGLTVKTINQYCRVTVAPAISRNTIVKAETILKGL